MNETGSANKTEDPISIPPICNRHQIRIVRELKIPPSGPWRVAVVTANILVFQWATADDRIWKQAEGKTENLSDVLARIGCLACWSEDGFDVVMKVMHKGVSHAAQVSQGKRDDPDWISELRIKPA